MASSTSITLKNHWEGEISLDVTEVLRIDPFAIDPEDPPLFQMAAKDKIENLYLADSRNIKIFKFDPSGKLLFQFLRQGQGPGEFPRFGDLQISNDHLWVIGTWPLKIAKFTSDGQYVNEWLFQTFRHFYLRTQVIDENRFLTVSYQEGTEIQDRTRISVLIDSSEGFITQYFENKSAGIFRIQTLQQEGPAIASTNPLVASDIHHAYDRTSGVIYVCNNKDYIIHAKNLDGTTRMVIHRAHKKIFMDGAKRERILQMIAPRIPVQTKKHAKEQLPDALNAIFGLEILPNEHLAVKRFTGLESIEIDVFDREGRFIKTIVPSTEIPDLKDVRLFENTIGVITELEDKNIYVEYRVNNLRGIFNRR